MSDAACSSPHSQPAHIHLRIGAIFILWATSSSATLFPVLTRRWQKRGSLSGFLFDFAKFFGSGVIIATAFIHLLAPSFAALTSPCLPDVFSLYPFAPALSLFAVFAVFLLELFAFRWGHVHAAKLAYDSHLAAHAGAHGPEAGCVVHEQERDCLDRKASHSHSHLHPNACAQSDGHGHKADVKQRQAHPCKIVRSDAGESTSSKQAQFDVSPDDEDAGSLLDSTGRDGRHGRRNHRQVYDQHDHCITHSHDHSSHASAAHSHSHTHHHGRLQSAPTMQPSAASFFSLTNDGAAGAAGVRDGGKRRYGDVGGAAAAAAEEGEGGGEGAVMESTPALLKDGGVIPASSAIPPAKAAVTSQQASLKTTLFSEPSGVHDGIVQGQRRSRTGADVDDAIAPCEAEVDGEVDGESSAMANSKRTSFSTSSSTSASARSSPAGASATPVAQQTATGGHVAVPRSYPADSLKSVDSAKADADAELEGVEGQDEDAEERKAKMSAPRKRSTTFWKSGRGRKGVLNGGRARVGLGRKRSDPEGGRGSDSVDDVHGTNSESEEEGGSDLDLERRAGRGVGGPGGHDAAATAKTAEAAAAQILGVLVLEFGIVFHSVIIGLTLGVTDGFVVLFVVIVFHQMFEGLGLGTRLAHLPLSPISKVPLLGALLYGLVTPLGLTVGLALRSSYDPESATAQIVSGCLDGFSSGILLYSGLVELLAHEFIFNDAMRTAPTGKVLLACGEMVVGAGLMALLGRWA